MPHEVECGVVASLLDSGTTLANASHAAAVIAGIGCLMAHPVSARLAFGGAILCWFIECTLAARTRIDAALFRVLADQPAARVDEVLVRWKLIPNARERSIDNRCRGALRLWRVQIAAFVIQCSVLTVALILSGTG